MSIAQHIVEQLLDEAILLPVWRWNYKHLIERYAERLERIDVTERPMHAKAIEAMFVKFRNNTRPITVGNQEWWMPFPLGWRLLGENNRVNSILEPAQAIATERSENPFLSYSDRTFWRDKV